MQLEHFRLKKKEDKVINLKLDIYIYILVIKINHDRWDNMLLIKIIIAFTKCKYVNI